MHELAALQTIRLKGQASPATLAETLGLSADTVATVLDELAGAGLLAGGDSVKLSAAGRVRCDELLAAERASADSHALAAVYAEFHAVNTELKALVTEWQRSKRDPVTNGETLARLDRVHRAIMPIIAAAAAQLPRLAGYADRLQTALARIDAGEIGWLARPMADSYHTVWFELHEELIRACGLIRRSDG